MISVNRHCGSCVVNYMDTTTLDKKFVQIGARLKVNDQPPRRFRMAGSLALDIQSDRKGEYFEVIHQPGADVALEVLDVQPADRHLLLLVREGKEKSKYLCGHDERHWFVAGVPDKAPVGTVRQAKEALKPVEVQAAQAREAVRGKDRFRRKNAAYVRQGEWFFVPAPDFVADEASVRPSEPLVRSTGGKPHWVDFCCRVGGEKVFVCRRHPNGVGDATYQKMLKTNPEATTWGWRYMVRNPTVYVRGRVRHPDHNTIVLHSWHRVFMNTEGQSRAMRNVAFLD
jgi:hypothetical protein